MEQEFIDILTGQGYEQLKIKDEAALIQNLRRKLEVVNDYSFTENEWERFFTESLANANEGDCRKDPQNTGRQKGEEHTLLYHGSNREITKPQLIEQTRGLDFGEGFYCTTSGEQAVRFSKIVTNRRKSGAATVNVYEYDMDTAEKTLAIRKLANADAEWLEFVKDNRLKQYTGEIYDIVIGAVANDTVMPTIQAYLSGLQSVEAAIVTLKTSKLVDQVCLKTEKARALLKFMRAEVA